MIWYFGPSFEEYIGFSFDVHNDKPESYTNISDADWNKWKAKITVDYDNARVSNFSDWLELLD